MFSELLQRVGPALLRQNALATRPSLLSALPRPATRSYSYLPPPAPSVRPAGFSSHVYGNQGEEWGRIINSASPKVKVLTPEEKWAARESSLKMLPPIAHAYSGRSVKVVKGAVDEAYFKLIQIIKRNNVVGELRLAKRHEKRGVKRRRLESKRWRTQFANEVRKKVQLVNEIRKQGA